MEFSFNVNEVFKSPIVEITPNLIPPGYTGDRRALWDTVSKVGEVVNQMGSASAAAQGLTKPITTADRIRNSEHKLYFLIDKNANSGKGAVTGMLKTGNKSLYVFDRDGNHYQVQPPCLLDFYIHETKQRNGLGKVLFEHMLQKEGIAPVQMAIDRPSEKLLGFLNKHYSLKDPVKQMNNYVVFDDFFPKRTLPAPPEPQTQSEAIRSKIQQNTNSANGLQAVPSPMGRYGAPRPPCSMGQIIHNQSPNEQRQEATGQSMPAMNYQAYQQSYSTENPAYSSQSTPNTYYGQNNYNQYQAQMQGNYQNATGQNWQPDPNNMTPQEMYQGYGATGQMLQGTTSGYPVQGQNIQNAAQNMSYQNQTLGQYNNLNIQQNYPMEQTTTYHDSYQPPAPIQSDKTANASYAGTTQQAQMSHAYQYQQSPDPNAQNIATQQQADQMAAAQQQAVNTAFQQQQQQAADTAAQEQAVNIAANMAAQENIAAQEQAATLAAQQAANSAGQQQAANMAAQQQAANMTAQQQAANMVAQQQAANMAAQQQAANMAAQQQAANMAAQQQAAAMAAQQQAAQQQAAAMAAQQQAEMAAQEQTAYLVAQQQANMAAQQQAANMAAQQQAANMAAQQQAATMAAYKYAQNVPQSMEQLVPQQTRPQFTAPLMPTVTSQVAYQPVQGVLSAPLHHSQPMAQFGAPSASAPSFAANQVSSGLSITNFNRNTPQAMQTYNMAAAGDQARRVMSAAGTPSYATPVVSKLEIPQNLQYSTNAPSIRAQNLPTRNFSEKTQNYAAGGQIGDLDSQQNAQLQQENFINEMGDRPYSAGVCGADRFKVKELIRKKNDGTDYIKKPTENDLKYGYPPQVSQSRIFTRPIPIRPQYS